jgi:phosphomannomutase
MVAFGTSGLRGLVSELTDEVAYGHALAFLQYLKDVGEFDVGGQVILGGDLRPSTPRLLLAVWAAVEAAGGIPSFAGYLPSPALALAGFGAKVPSLMVTGSHIPFDRNGIKFNRPSGELMKADEPGILGHLSAPDSTLFDSDGRLREAPRLPSPDERWRTEYVSRYLDFFGEGSLTGLRLGVYQHSGVARDLLPQVLRDLGAEVIELGRSDAFVALDTEALRPEDAVLAKDWVEQYSLDALLTTDGDADRPMIADERGDWWRGDVLGIIVAQALGVQSVVTPVSSNTALERTNAFERVWRTRIGSPYVIEAMQAEVERGASSVGGYEANGGFLLGSALHQGDRVLAPFPTRDAFLPMLTVLVQAKRQGLPLSALLEKLPSRYTASNRLQDFPVAKTRECLGRFIGVDKAQGLLAFADEFGGVCGQAESMDLTDGVRATFANGEILHLRPSGNAPELRCYTEADSPDRAQAILKAAMAVMESWR